MKKLLMTLFTGLAVLFFSCTNTDDTEELKPENNVVLNTDIETVISTEEASEAVVEVADYEVDLFSFIESEYDKPAGTKNDRYNFYTQLFMKWQRYISERMPDITIKFDEKSQFPMTITINYGDSTILSDNRVISGTTEIKLPASLFTNNAIREIIFDLTIDSIAIKGNARIEFTGKTDVSKKWKYTSEITFKYPDGTELFRSAERTREWVSGLDTKWDLSDDKVEIRGSVTCIDSEKNEYTKEIVDKNPLVKIGSCKAIVKGIAVFSQNGKEFAKLNYGDGKCDNIATYTYTNGDDEKVTKEVEIGKHNRRKTNSDK